MADGSQRRIMGRPVSPDDCVALLRAVLTCLDDATTTEEDDQRGRNLMFAAVRVQEAIDLIDHTPPLDS